jgi:hypothetical protein
MEIAISKPNGKETLSSLPVALNLLAFAMHGVCDPPPQTA